MELENDFVCNMIDLVIKRPGDKILDNQIVEKIRKKQKYNKLLKEAKELGRQLEIPEAELQDIEFTTF